MVIKSHGLTDRSVSLKVKRVGKRRRGWGGGGGGVDGRKEKENVHCCPASLRATYEARAQTGLGQRAITCVPSGASVQTTAVAVELRSIKSTMLESHRARSGPALALVAREPRIDLFERPCVIHKP